MWRTARLIMLIEVICSTSGVSERQQVPFPAYLSYFICVYVLKSTSIVCHFIY